MKTLKVAQSAGFCGGVARALKLAEEALAQHGECWSLGQIIHNDDVVLRLESKGLHTAKHPEVIPDGAVAIIRSHGEAREVTESLALRGVKVLDATCPNVRHIQNLVSDAEKKGRKVLVVGDATHPEVIGICGWCDDASVVGDELELTKWLDEEPSRREIPLTLVFQTTLQRKNSKKLRVFFKKTVYKC